METCPKCGVQYDVGDWPFCKGGHGRGHGLLGEFKSFDTHIEGMGHVRIDSMEKLRSVERESMQRWKNGEKVAPTRFRNYSQDHSNMGVNTFGNTQERNVRELTTRAASAIQELRKMGIKDDGRNPAPRAVRKSG